MTQNNGIFLYTRSVDVCQSSFKHLPDYQIHADDSKLYIGFRRNDIEAQMEDKETIKNCIYNRYRRIKSIIYCYVCSPNGRYVCFPSDKQKWQYLCDYELRTTSTLSTGLLPSILGLSYWIKFFSGHQILFEKVHSVKQGGVLFANFVSIYLFELLLILKKSGIGCHIGNVFVAGLAYADDVTLICPTLKLLKMIIKICEDLCDYV